MERALLQSYNEVVTQMGNFSDGTSLANSHWAAIQKSFNEKHELRKPLGKDKLQSRLSVLKRKYGVWKWLGGYSGFTVDESGQVHGDSECWSKIIEICKSGTDKEKLGWVKHFQSHPLDCVDSFEAAFEGRVATGQHSRSAKRPPEDKPDAKAAQKESHSMNKAAVAAAQHSLSMDVIYEVGLVKGHFQTSCITSVCLSAHSRALCC